MVIIYMVIKITESNRLNESLIEHYCLHQFYFVQTDMPPGIIHVFA